MSGVGKKDENQGYTNNTLDLSGDEFADVSLGSTTTDNEISGNQSHGHTSQKRQWIKKQFALFRFADGLDKLLMSVGTLSLMSIGAAIAFNVFNFGDLISKFIIFETPNLTALASSNNSVQAECAHRRLYELSQNNVEPGAEDTMQSLVMAFAFNFAATGVYILIAAYLGITLWTWTGERQVRRIRTAYFEAVMRQSVGWFDEHKSGELNSHMVKGVEKLSNGFGNKMALFIQWSSTSFGGFAVAVSVGWRLSLVTSATCPLYIAVLMLAIKYIKKYMKREVEASAKAGAVVEETFSSIKTVAAFGGERKAEERFAAELNGVWKDRLKKAAAGCTLASIISFAGFCLTALALWYGGKLVREDCMPPGYILQVFFGILTGTLYLGSAAPLLENFASATTSAEALYRIIDDVVEIDSSSEDGLKTHIIGGEIQFMNVSFSYPLRKESKILDGMNLSVQRGETVALVGESGCGKSTTLHLLQRFYNCDEGKVLIDGKDLKSYNLSSLRNYMGIVSQEPVLFATTIGENIRLGAKWGDEVTQERIEQAAKLSNCYDFICQLPQGFGTLVGDRGVQLSGGQKQRIAIARALVRDPAILLLDEATSALDTQSELAVQGALCKASKGRTTLVIAHRLSTVKSADRICVFRDGRVHEEGAHDYLLSLKGLYYSLVMRQLQQEREECLRKPTIEKSIEKENGSFPDKLYSHHLPVSPLCKMSPQPVCDDERTKKFGQPFNQKNSENAGKKIDEEPTISMMDIIKMNKPELPLMVLGVFAATINGTANLLFAILLSDAVGALSEPDLELQEQRVNSMALYTVLAALLTGCASIVQHFTLTLSGEQMTNRLRTQSFSSFIKQEMAFFDKEENGVAAINCRLLSDAALIKGATGTRLGILTHAFTTIAGGFVIAFTHIWELALAALIFTPIMVASGTVQERFHRGHLYKNTAALEKGEKMAQETISNMQTVTSLNRQRYFTDKFSQHFKALYQSERKKIFIRGIAYSLAQSAQFFMYAVCYGYGGYLITCGCLPWRTEKIPFHYVLRIFAAVIFGSTAAGRSMAQLPDLYRSKLAAFNIRKILKLKSPIDPYSEEGVTLNEMQGNVEFNQVKFNYPTRPTVQVLQGATFNVKSGETLALVGASGCGKSTSISLLERFYDSLSGQVSVDGEDVKSLNTQWLRHQLGLVSQEPTLFDKTIKENIAYGDNTRDVPMEEIIDAAVNANAHGFITSLPQGYETNVGAKGTQLSGGQKQRIAIARALVRNPVILLLDEATSALDTESEKIVQEALDKAMAGRTAIVIAHRLSTVKNANRIGVIDNGRIVEMGSHDELIEKKGFYYSLVQAQIGEGA